jgi:hypothetical protein
VIYVFVKKEDLMKKVYCFSLLVSFLVLAGTAYAQDAAVNTTANASVNSTANTADAATGVVAPVSALAAQPAAVQEPAVSQVSSKQPAEALLVKGNVEEVAADGTYLMIAGTKVLTTKEMIEDAYVEVGDKVEASVEQTADGKKLVNLKYIFDDEEPVVESNTTVVPSEPVKTEAQQ